MPPSPTATTRQNRPCRLRAGDADRGRPRDGRHRAGGADGRSSLRGRRRRHRGSRRHRRRHHRRDHRRDRRSRRRHRRGSRRRDRRSRRDHGRRARRVVALAHHHRRLGLVRLDLDGEKAEHLGGQAHAPLHLGHGRRRRIDVEQREVRLAALLDLVGEAFDAPVLALGDLAATLLDEIGEFFGECLDLGVGDVLAREEHMLVESHADSLSFCSCRPGAKPLMDPRKAQAGHP